MRGGGGGGEAYCLPPFHGLAEPVESSARGRFFPLPVFRIPERGDSGRCGEACRLVSDAIWAPNWSDGRLANRAQQRRAVPEAVSRMHAQVIARPYGLSNAWIDRRRAVADDSEAPCKHSEAAFHWLLKGRGCYDGTTAPNNLAPCCLPRISLPTSWDTAPNLVERVPPDVLPFLQGDHERMLRSKADRQSIVDAGDLTKPYIDPVLRRNRRVLIRFVKRCCGSSLPELP